MSAPVEPVEPVDQPQQLETVDAIETPATTTATETPEPTPSTEAEETQTGETTEVDSEPIPEKPKPKPKPNLKNLPSLLSGSSAVTTAKVAWGPNMKPVAPLSVTPVSTPSLPSSASGSGSSSPVSAKRMKSKTVQKTFSMDLESQLSITKPELSRIIQSIKQAHNVSIESTLSRNSRIFLISGTVKNVQAAEGELIKKLTKPITVQFEIPSQCKSSIIGQGGRTIREMSEEFEVKINVAKESIEGSFDEDLNDDMTMVTLFGDYNSVKLAKDKIMAIVKERTKNSTARITIKNATILPFVGLSKFEPLNDSEDVKIQFYPEQTSADVVITGPREEVNSLKTKIQNLLSGLENDITEEKVKIPTRFQTVIDGDALKDKFNVIVKFPEDSHDEFVSFIGQTDSVGEAISFARSSSKAYSVDSLDISKAHSNNIAHARNLALYFKKYPAVLKPILDDYPTVKISLPKLSALTDPEATSVDLVISAKSENTKDIKAARKEVVALVNNISPSDTLCVDDIDYDLFHKNANHILLATEEQVSFVIVGDYVPGDNTIILIANNSDEDFKPSTEEVQKKLQEINHSLDTLREKQKELHTKVYELSSKKQDKFFGSDSIFRKLITEGIDSGNGFVQFKLHTPSESQFTIRGPEKAVKLADKDINQVLADTSEKAKQTVDVPGNTVSRIIGNKGSNLQAIREKFGIQIDIPQSDGKGQDLSQPVTITLVGNPYVLAHAKRYLQAEAKKWADIVTKELIVPIKYHRNLIGPNGVYRNRLQDKYNVFINFPRTSEVVTVRGPSRGVKQAYEELKNLLDFEMENSHKVVIPVPAEHVPRVIGKNGDVINDIRAEFGVEMEFLDKPSGGSAKEGESVNLEITGTRQAIKDAQKKVEEVIAAAEDYTIESIDVPRKYHKVIVGAGGNKLREIITKAGGDEIRNRAVDIPNADSQSDKITVQGPKKFVKKVIEQIQQIVKEGENSITKELNIEKERQGALVGPGGYVRRQLESEFNVVIQIPNKDQEGPVTITGLPENVEKAEKKIMTEILRDDFDIELKVPASLHAFISERGALFQKLRLDYFVNVRHGSSSRRAQRLNKGRLNIPLSVVRPATEDEKKQKYKVTILEVGEPAKEGEEGDIPWRLKYEPIDVEDLLNESGEGDKKSEPKKVDEQKKKEALDKVSKLINDKIARIPEITYAGYIWVPDVKILNRVIGPGGSNINKMRKETDAYIYIPRRSEDVNDVIYIRGSKEDVEKSVKMITETLN